MAIVAREIGKMGSWFNAIRNIQGVIQPPISPTQSFLHPRGNLEERVLIIERKLGIK